MIKKKWRKLDEWFDWECKVVRRNVRRLLKKYRRSLLADDRDAFCLARREYKNSLKKKRKQFFVAFEQIDFISEKSRKTFGNLYISYYPKESPKMIFLWIVGSSILERYFKKK